MSSSLREDVLNAIPADAREGVLKMALDHNITDPNDPIWAMVALAWTAARSAHVSRASLESVRVETARIPAAMAVATTTAVADLRAQITDAAREVATTVAQGLDHNLEATKQAALAEWKSALGRAAMDQSRKSFLTHMQMSVVTIAIILVLFMGLGATAAFSILDAFHHVTPYGIHLYSHDLPSRYDSGEIAFRSPIVARFVPCHDTGRDTGACLDFHPRGSR
ncbi:MAG: hypothetical protein ACYDEV_08830 [Acidiferrobacter sp.]